MNDKRLLEMLRSQLRSVGTQTKRKRKALTHEERVKKMVQSVDIFDEKERLDNRNENK